MDFLSSFSAFDKSAAGLESPMPSTILKQDAQTFGFRESDLLLSEIGSQQQMQMVGLNLLLDSVRLKVYSSKTY
jgi:hypothetical protein